METLDDVIRLWRVWRVHAAQNEATRPEVLDVLANDSDAEVRYYVAGHPATAKSTRARLAVLANDAAAVAHCYITGTAKITLARLDVLMSAMADSVTICYAPSPSQGPAYTAEIVRVNRYVPGAGSTYGTAYCDVRFNGAKETYRRAIRIPLESAD